MSRSESRAGVDIRADYEEAITPVARIPSSEPSDHLNFLTSRIVTRAGDISNSGRHESSPVDGHLATSASRIVTPAPLIVQQPSRGAAPGALDQRGNLPTTRPTTAHSPRRFGMNPPTQSTHLEGSGRPACVGAYRTTSRIVSKVPAPEWSSPNQGASRPARDDRKRHAATLLPTRDDSRRDRIDHPTCAGQGPEHGATPSRQTWVHDDSTRPSTNSRHRLA